ncbi:hypothetical protein [uncultured Roseivirga sp.]|uniref:Spy/CpxP family protein refolding chaperone n=1 Tax=uncultured Roseivirga sp. TaxID=543088 RepID=UPI0030D99F00|tara:strand:+ start:92 stop:625 length:534 start_codon:yes stop_codon:yes gene_type:complete
MDFIRRNKLLGSAVIILVIFNATLLVFLWLGRLDNNREIKGPEGKGKFLEESLNFSPEQFKKFELLKKEHFRLIDQYQREFNDARRELHGLLKQENSSQKTKLLSAKMGEIQSNIEYATFNHFASIRAICTPEQQGTFDKIISEVLRKEPSGQRPQGARPPGPGGPEGKKPPPRGGR